MLLKCTVHRPIVHRFPSLTLHTCTVVCFCFPLLLPYLFWENISQKKDDGTKKKVHTSQGLILGPDASYHYDMNICNDFELLREDPKKV